MQKLAPIVPRRLSILINDNPVAASAVLTSDETQVTNAKKVTLGLLEYVFKTTLTGAAYEVEIGADADASLQNLANLINEGRAAVKAETDLTSNNTNVTAGKVVVLGTKTYKFVEALTEAKAAGILTSDNTNPAAGDTVTIGSKIYTFVTAFSSHVANEIMIGSDADTTLANLVAAINGASGKGEKYSVPTEAQTLVTASAVSEHAITITYNTVGVAGNAFVKAESSAHLDWDGTGGFLTGGLDSIANEVLIGDDADESLANLKAAINGAAGSGTTYSSATVASTEVEAGAIASHVLAISALDAGIDGNALASTTDEATLGFTSTVLAGGVDETPINTQVSSSDVAAHAITVTALVAGAAGNLIAKAEDDAHLDWDGTGDTLTGGGSTIGTSEPIGKGGGVLRSITAIIPQLVGTPNTTVSIMNAQGEALYTTGNLTENTITRTAIEQMLAATDYFKITTSTVVDEALPIVLELR